MTVIFKKIKDAQPMGEYTPTLIDQKKDEATLRLLQVSPKIVASKIALSGRGIKPIEGNYQVSDKAWEKLKEKYSWMTDF